MKKHHKQTNFGKQVKIRLLEIDMTSKELARMLGLTESTLCDVLHGRNKSESTQKIIAKALDIKEGEI